MFTSKQSDFWYKEDTNEFLVCSITSLSAKDPNDDCIDLYTHYPIVYSINRDTNEKRVIFPSDGQGQLSDAYTIGYIYDLVPEVNVDINISEISKPIISYNEKKDLYNVTFLGKYQNKDDGFCVFTYIFQYSHDIMTAVDSKVILPSTKDHIQIDYSFSNGHIHNDLYVGSNTTSTFDTHFGYIGNQNIGEMPPNYNIVPFHREPDLIFNTILHTGIVEIDKQTIVTKSTTSTNNVTRIYTSITTTPSSSTTETSATSTNTISTTSGILSSSDITTTTTTKPTISVPIGYSGGFIAQTKESRPFKTEDCIRVDFTCKSYSLEDQIGALSTKYIIEGNKARTIELYSLSSQPAEGFAVFFYEDDIEYDLDLNGVNSSYGFCTSDYNEFEVNGFDKFPTDGINLDGYLCVAFDIVGNFCTKFEGKPGAYSSEVTFAQAPSSIGIRAGTKNSYVALSQSKTIEYPLLHETVSEGSLASYKDFRVELGRKGKEIIILGKNNSDPDYAIMHRIDMTSLSGFNFTVPEKLKVGLCSVTSLNVFNFELKSFKVEGTHA